MSTLKTVNVQVGQSATATNNFTLYQPASPDGTVRLGVGNSGATTADAVIVTNAGNATLLGNLTVSGTGTTAIAGTLTVNGGLTASRIVQGTAQATTSGTAVGFTGIPSWVKRITFHIMGASASTSNGFIQIGSGSYVSSGYNTAYYNSAGYAATTTGILACVTSATGPSYGQIILSLANNSTNTWVAAGNFFATGFVTSVAGSVSLSGALDRIQITTASGTFSAGSVNIIYEG